MFNTIKNISLFIFVTLLFSACEEDFDITTEYKDQTVVYAFLDHQDPWNELTDTNWIVVNKAFLGETNVYDMAGVADSVNYDNYDNIIVTIQRIKSIDPNSEILEPADTLRYTTHIKDVGHFATDNNIIFYTTKSLMTYKNIDLDPTPNIYDETKQYYYKLTVFKNGQNSVSATTKMIRGITIERGVLYRDENHRILNMASTFPNYTFKIEFGSNIDARVYDIKIRTFFYEKRTDGNIYLDYSDYEHPLIITNTKTPTASIKMEANIAPASYYASFDKHLRDVSDVVWRVPKLTLKNNFTHLTHAVLFTLGSQETYIYNQVTQPSNGIVQEKPTYSNITNGLGIFTSKWNWKRDHFQLTQGTIDSLAMGVSTKNLKFQDYGHSVSINDLIDANEIIITDRVKALSN